MKNISNIMKKRTILVILSLLFITAAALFVAGCARRAPQTPLSGSSSNAQQRQADLQSLKANGVQVIRLGQTVRIIMPSDQVFIAGTEKLNKNYDAVLNDVASYMNTYRIVTARVAAYTDTQAARIHRNALTTKQAEEVQAYLSNCGIKARLIYAQGRGAKNQVAGNYTQGGRASNRRVEVSFRFYTLK